MKQHFIQLEDSAGFQGDTVTRFIAPDLLLNPPSQPSLSARLQRLRAAALLASAERHAAQDLPPPDIDSWPDKPPFHYLAGSTPAPMIAPGPDRIMMEERVAMLYQLDKIPASLRLHRLLGKLAQGDFLWPACSTFSWKPGRYGDHSASQRRSDPGWQSPEQAFADSLLIGQISKQQQKIQELETELAAGRQHEQELAQQVAELTATDRRKDEFLAMLGHELRNPLAPIGISLKLLRLQQGDDCRCVPWLDIIARQTLLMKRLVDDLLDVSRIQLGKMALQKQTVSLTTIIDRAIELVSPLLNSLQHALLIDLPAEPVTLYGDPERLEQAVANLLQNAAKYSGTDAQIRLHVHQQEQELVISVSDNGSGLSAEFLQQAFDLFAQDQANLAHSRGGLGIGLALVRQIVHLHGGSTHAFSNGSGCGSEFVIHLPLTALPVT